MKKNQERRLHRKNAKIVKEGGTPLQLGRPMKADTTVSALHRRPGRCIVVLTLHSSVVVATVGRLGT